MQWPHIWIFQPTFNLFHYKCRFTLRGKLGWVTVVVFWFWDNPGNNNPSILAQIMSVYLHVFFPDHGRPLLHGNHPLWNSNLNPNQYQLIPSVTCLPLTSRLKLKWERSRTCHSSALSLVYVYTLELAWPPPETRSTRSHHEMHAI